MDASQYKDYVLVLLFMKYVTDRFRGDPDAPIAVPEGGSFDDMLAVRGDPEIGDKINQIVAKLAETNVALSGVITAADFADPQKLGDGKEMVERLSNLVSIFARPELDFSGNDAEGDDLLGDAYEYLMRHFAVQGGKSKGQFYTPAEVSRVIAQLVGADSAKAASETAYDPTCGSASLLLKVQAAAPVKVTLYGQEKDNATRALAVMNTVLHGDATADIRLGNTLANPRFAGADDRVQTFDYVVANPPFSDKAWRNGLTPETDPRFARFGIPPNKQGDYAYLLHVVASMKARGRAVVVLPHGVLFRGNAEGVIRRKLVERGLIAGLVGLPANLFYGTGIPACLVVLDKGRTPGGPIMIIDASRGFVKDGPKNRLRHQDAHRIVDSWNKQAEVPGYARLVPIEEIERNGFNLNLPRYIDSGRVADRHDLAAHILGGIPAADVDALGDWWAVMPELRHALFRPGPRDGSLEAIPNVGEVRDTISAAPEMAAFADRVQQAFDGWRAAHVARLEAIDADTRPKDLIETLAEDLLDRFRPLPLLDAYDVYQRLMTIWDDGMGDDVSILVRDGWAAARVIDVVLKDKDGKLSETPDLVIGRGRGVIRYKAQIIPPDLIVKRFYADEAEELAEAEAEAERIAGEVEALALEQDGEDALLFEALDDKDRLTEAGIKARRAVVRAEVTGKTRGRITRDDETAIERSEFADQWAALSAAAELVTRSGEAKAKAKRLRTALDEATVARYATLTEDEAKLLIVHDKWLLSLEKSILMEEARMVAELGSHVRTLIDRYETPLPTLIATRETATARVREHLAEMGVAWN
jgi:type I restriction enzyme M protein